MCMGLSYKNIFMLFLYLCYAFDSDISYIWPFYSDLDALGMNTLVLGKALQWFFDCCFMGYTKPNMALAHLDSDS